MTKSFFTADPHFGHTRITNDGWRPFSTIEVWNDYFIDKINSKVGRNDILWILGDFCFGDDPMKYRTRIRCKDVRLIFGNHDNRQKCKKCFTYYYDIRTVSINKMPVILCHYPMAYWHKSHYGSGMLYGHIHSQRQQTLDQLFPGIRALDVSPDMYAVMFNDWNVFSDQEVYDILSQKPGHDNVDFYHEYQKENWSGRPLIK